MNFSLQSLSKMNSKINWIMAKFLGVETDDKMWKAVLIFILITVWPPTQCILGSVVIGDCTSQPKLPSIMVSMGVVETFGFYYCFSFTCIFLGRIIKRGRLQSQKQNT